LQHRVPVAVRVVFVEGQVAQKQQQAGVGALAEAPREPVDLVERPLEIDRVFVQAGLELRLDRIDLIVPRRWGARRWGARRWRAGWRRHSGNIWPTPSGSTRQAAAAAAAASFRPTVQKGC